MENLKNLAAALIAAQNEMPQLFNTANGVYNNKYAPLSEVQSTCLPVLRKHGIAVMQGTDSEVLDNKTLVVKVKTTFCHASSGETWTESIGMIPAKQDPQGVGSAITYGRRYLLTTMAGLASEDDDGNSASNTNGHQPQQTAPQKPVPQRQQAPKRPVMVINGDTSQLEEALDFTMNDVPEMPFDNRPTMRDQRAAQAQQQEEIAEGAGEFYAELSKTDFLGQIDSRSQDMMMYLRKQDADSDNPMSEKQYGFMVAKVNERYGPDMHTAILSFLFGKAISSENRPGWKVPGNDKYPGLLQWLINPDDHAEKVAMLDHVADALLESMRVPA